MLDDLATDAKLIGEREVHTIFFGGGTPSLFSPQGIADILQGVSQRVNLATDAEITLEANPDDLSKNQLQRLGQSPINRLSIGIQ